jgi:hypothetical protein
LPLTFFGALYAIEALALKLGLFQLKKASAFCKACSLLIGSAFTDTIENNNAMARNKNLMCKHFFITQQF